MTISRVLVEDTASYSKYDVFDNGVKIGTDVVQKLGPEETNQQTIQQRAQQALTANDTFLAIASPTQAQTLAQVKVLTRECSGLIRLLLSQFDTTAGT